MKYLKPKKIVFRVQAPFSDNRVLIVGRLYVGYVGIILNLPGILSFDLWFLKWQKGYKPLV